MAKDTARRNPAKESAWRRWVAKHADSGLSVWEFCRQHDLKEAAFYQWRRELTRRDVERDEVAAAFVPVHITDDAANYDRGVIEIVMACGRLVRVNGSVDQRVLCNVLDVLERRAC